MLRLFPQVPENLRDQSYKGVPSAENLRTVKGAATQKRLEGLNQPTLRFCGKVVFNSLWPRPRFKNIRASFLHLLQIQQRAIRVSHASQVREPGKLNLV